MNIFFDSIHLYLSLRTYIEDTYSLGYKLDTNNKIKRDETILFKNGFYEMPLSQHVETLFEQLAYHCHSEKPDTITRYEFVNGYSQYDDAGDLFDKLCSDTEYLNAEIIINIVLSLTRYQIQDLMSCIFMTTSVDLSRNGIGNDTYSGNGDTPILLHSDNSNNSIKESFASFKEMNQNEVYLTQYEDALVYSNCQQMSPISVTNSFNMDSKLHISRNHSYPTLDITNYNPSIQTGTCLLQTYSAQSPKHMDINDINNINDKTKIGGGDGIRSIDLSNQTLDISNTNSIVTIHLPEPVTYSLDNSFSSYLHPKQKAKKDICELLCKCSIFSFCTR